MQENTNKSLAINSVILYSKMAVNTVLALFTTRFALQALGVNDFGLFSVVGSVISFIGIFNTIMVSTCNRFIAVAIGRGDEGEINKVFNVNLIIFISCAIILLLIALPIGHWYIVHYVKYSGSIDNALLVYYFSIAASIMSTLSIPYNGLLMAKERFVVISTVDVIIHIVKFLIAYLLIYHFTNKLLIYSVAMAFATTFPALCYWLYCNRKFNNLVRWNFVTDKSLYKQVFGFSGWVAYGAVACVAKQQGAALLINGFFNTVMNTALGIANSLNSYVTMFANTITQPMQPQITKSYAAGNKERTDDLLVMSTKFSFLLMLFVGAPFFVACDWILDLWLGVVPEYAVTFTILLIIDNLVQSFNLGLSNILFASGKIALYQVLINTIRLLSIAAAYIALKVGFPPSSLLYAYIIFSLITVIATQWVLNWTLHYDNRILLKRSYLPSIVVLLLFLPVCFLNFNIHPALNIVIVLIYLCILEFFVGLSKRERQYIVNKIKNRIV